MDSGPTTACIQSMRRFQGHGYACRSHHALHGSGHSVHGCSLMSNTCRFHHAAHAVEAANHLNLLSGLQAGPHVGRSVRIHAWRAERIRRRLSCRHMHAGTARKKPRHESRRDAHPCRAHTQKKKVQLQRHVQKERRCTHKADVAFT